MLRANIAAVIPHTRPEYSVAVSSGCCSSAARGESTSNSSSKIIITLASVCYATAVLQPLNTTRTNLYKGLGIYQNVSPQNTHCVTIRLPAAVVSPSFLRGGGTKASTTAGWHDISTAPLLSPPSSSTRTFPLLSQRCLRIRFLSHVYLLLTLKMLASLLLPLQRLALRLLLFYDTATSWKEKMI